MNAIYLRRRLKVILPREEGETSIEVIVALQKNLEDLGFALSREICVALQAIALSKVEIFYRNLVSELRELVGAHRQFRPMYPNFPEQVMQTDEARLYWNAFVHYWTNHVPEYPKKERPPLGEQTKFKIISLGSRDDFEQIFTQLVAAKTSLAGNDKADLVWFVNQYRDSITRLLPAEISHKENLAVVGAALLRSTSIGPRWLDTHVKTATDVLRLAVALSDGDVSLKEPTKFAKFTRPQRNILLGWVDRCASATEDMLRWKARWIRLGERLHPGEYLHRFPRAAAAFDILRNDKPYETFNGAVEHRIASGDADAAVALLRTRPGELTRRLDHLLRTAPNPQEVISSFGDCASQVSTPVLLQAMTHFARRSEPAPLRVFFPKGSVAKIQAVPNSLPALPAGSAEAVREICQRSLIERFAKLPPLGPCYLAPELTDYLAPFSQRSAAKALRTLVRGSRLPLPATKILRFFIWWKNGSSRTDIDLSAALYSDSFRFIDVLSYYNLKNVGGCHSGDIVNAPQGASEFIDIDIDKTRDQGVRYVVMCINSFTMQPYCDLPECFAGWMARHEAGSGEVYEPRTVQDRVDIASDTKVCLPAVFDLVEQRVIWADIALKAANFWNNVANNEIGISLMLQAITGLRKPTLHTLFDLHIQARGSRVANASNARTVFSSTEGITPFDLDRIRADFL